MALNLVNRTRVLNMPVNAGTVSGSPVYMGNAVGHALNDRDAAGNADVEFTTTFDIISIPVTARKTVGNIARFDVLYIHTALAPPAPDVVDNDAAGIRYGVANETLAVVGGIDTVGTIQVIVGCF
jgi:hypothetical protein